MGEENATLEQLLIENIKFTGMMSKYGYSGKNENYGIGIVINNRVGSEMFAEWGKTEEGAFTAQYFSKNKATIENNYEYYKILVEDGLSKPIKMYGYDNFYYNVDPTQKHIDYAKRSETVDNIGIYDYKNVKYAIDMDYLDTLSETKKENYLKQCFLNNYLYLGTAYNGELYSQEIQDFLKIEPFFKFDMPSHEQMGLSWPIIDEYEEKDVLDDDYLDMKKFLEINDDTIVLCMVSEPNPEFPDYYSPDPEFVFPITRSYLKNLYNPLEEDGTYKEDFISFAYRCAKDIEGIDDDLTFNVTMNQLYLLKPYFKITGGPQEIYINTRDAMMMMYSTHKVFSLRKETEIPINAGINIVNVGNENVFGQMLDVVSADHCQSGSNKPVYRVMMADIEEYTEVEREDVSRKILTIEDVYEKYPETKEIVESSQSKQQKIMAANRLQIPAEYKTRVIQTVMEERTEMVILEPSQSQENPEIYDSQSQENPEMYDNIIDFYEQFQRPLSDEEEQELDRILNEASDIDDIVGELHGHFGLDDEDRLRQLLQREEGGILTSDMLRVIREHYVLMEEDQEISREDVEDATSIDEIINNLRSIHGLVNEDVLRNRLEQLDNREEEPLARQLNFDEEEESLARQLNFDEEEESLARQLNFDDEVGILEPIEHISDDEDWIIENL